MSADNRTDSWSCSGWFRSDFVAISSSRLVLLRIVNREPSLWAHPKERVPDVVPRAFDVPIAEPVCRRKPFGKNVEGLSIFRTSNYAIPDAVRLDDFQQ